MNIKRFCIDTIIYVVIIIGMVQKIKSFFIPINFTIWRLKQSTRKGHMNK